MLNIVKLSTLHCFSVCFTVNALLNILNDVLAWSYTVIVKEKCDFSNKICNGTYLLFVRFTFEVSVPLNSSLV